MNILKNPDGSDLILWHGTCADFDVFNPLSQFAVDKVISECAEFYKGVRKFPIRFLDENFREMDILNSMKKLNSYLTNFQNNQHVTPKKTEKNPNFKIIPVHLKMNNPLILDRWGFDVDAETKGLVWALDHESDHFTMSDLNTSNVRSDFIFKDSQMRSHDEIKKELELGHLFKISDNEKENKFYLTAQRLILFLESLGYDGIRYDQYKQESVDAYREGRVSNFDRRAFVIFRPEQVIRQDKQIIVASTKSSPKEKIELNKIFYTYQQGYRPYQTTITEQLNRVEYAGIIKNKVYSR